MTFFQTYSIETKLFYVVLNHEHTPSTNMHTMASVLAVVHILSYLSISPKYPFQGSGRNPMIVLKIPPLRTTPFSMKYLLVCRMISAVAKMRSEERRVGKENRSGRETN